MIVPKFKGDNRFCVIARNEFCPPLPLGNGIQDYTAYLLVFDEKRYLKKQPQFMGGLASSLLRVFKTGIASPFVKTSGDKASQ
jgi:hypothetical protein